MQVLSQLDRTSVVLVHDNMEDNEPTLANVEKHLTSLCKKANSESNHALFIHFSTHCEMIDEIPHLSLRDGCVLYVSTSITLNFFS